MSRRYEVQYHVRVTLDVADTVMERLERHEGLRKVVYDLSELEAAVFLASTIAFDGIPLSHIEGWKDLPDSSAQITIYSAVEGVEKISPGIES